MTAAVLAAVATSAPAGAAVFVQCPNDADQDAVPDVPTPGVALHAPDGR